MPACRLLPSSAAALASAAVSLQPMCCASVCDAIAVEYEYGSVSRTSALPTGSAQLPPVLRLLLLHALLHDTHFTEQPTALPRSSSPAAAAVVAGDPGMAPTQPQRPKKPYSSRQAA